MDYTQLKYLFYCILAITLIVYFIFDIVKYKMEQILNILNDYINLNDVFNIPFIYEAHKDFQDNPMVKQYIENYNYLILKKEKSFLSTSEENILISLEKDIQLLRISFLTSIVIDNKDMVDEELFKYIKKFIKAIKCAQILRLLRIILTIVSIVIFFKLFK